MCGRFTVAIDFSQLALDLDAELEPGLPAPSWNIAPTQTIAIAAQDDRGTRHIAPAYWSFIPSWADSKKLAYPTHNARIETALDKRTFSEAAHSHRAIIPATGYYEWDQHKTPHYFHDTERPILFLAGLYNWWRPNEQSPWLLTCTILTRQATGGAAEVHNRMPVLIGNDLVDPWLGPASEARSLMNEASAKGARLSDRLSSHTVAKLRGDGPQLIEPDEFALNI